MFTSRFIKLPIRVYNQRQAELTGNEDTNDIFTQVVPLQIEEYYIGEDDGQEITQVFLKSGRSFIVYLGLKEFEKRLNDHQKTEA